MIIDELIAVLGYDIRGEAELKRFNAGLERTAMIAQRMAAMVVAAGTIAAGAMFALGKSVIETSAEFEGFQTSLETIEGSADKAKASMDWITKFAAKTPYELAGVTDAFIKLKSYGIDPMDGTLSTLGDTASAMNKPLNMAVEAFADATSFQFERLREFGVVATQKGEEVTFKWTKNGKEFTKVVKKNGADIQKFLKDHWGKSFAGAMVRQSKTWNGMMSNLSDSWQLFKKAIGDAGFFNVVKGRLAGLLDYIANNSGGIDQLAKNFSDGLTWVFNTAIDQITAFVGDLKFLFGWIKLNADWWKPIQMGLIALGAVIFPKTFALLVLQDILRWLQGKGSVIGDFAKSLSELTGMDVGTSGTLLASLAAAGAGFLLFGGTFGKVAGGIRALAVAMGLMGSAQAAAGLGTLSSVGGLSMAGGLLALAASAAAAAGSIKLLYDAMKEDPKLTKALGEQLFNATDAVGTIIDKWFNAGDASKPEKGATAPDWVGPTGKAVPMTAKERAQNTYTAPVDWQMEQAKKETDRVRLGYGPQQPANNNGGVSRIEAMVSNLSAHMGKMSGDAAVPPIVDNRQDNRDQSISVNPSVSVTVQQIAAAASATAQKTADAVTGALKTVPSTSRTMRSAHF